MCYEILHIYNSMVHLHLFIQIAPNKTILFTNHCDITFMDLGKPFIDPLEMCVNLYTYMYNCIQLTLPAEFVFVRPEHREHTMGFQ